MNLDPGTLGGIHTLSSLAAILGGFLVLLLTKGTRWHRVLGRVYVLFMLATNLSALGLYAHGSFGIAHWMTLLNLAILTAGFAAIRLRRPARAWPSVHAGAMASSYFLLLLAGLNEVFLRFSFPADLEAKFELPFLQISLGLLFAVSVTTIGYLLGVTARRVEAGR